MEGHDYESTWAVPVANPGAALGGGRHHLACPVYIGLT